MMTKQELGSLVKLRAQDSLGTTGDTISQERQKALKYYRGDPFGNEEEGRSQIVSRDVAEAVDGLMPSLMRVFFAGDETVRFEPTGMEDEKVADQATDYINWIFQTQNEGTKIGHTWIKDALLQKVGVLKIWWDDTEEVTTERYQGLDELQYQILMADEDIEADEVEEIVTPISPEQLMGMPVNVPVNMKTYNVTISRTNKDGRVRLANVPPEEFGIERATVDLDDDCLYCHHQFTDTVSNLLAQGYKKTDVMNAGYEDDVTTDLTGMKATRFEYEDQIPWDDFTDQSTRKVLVTEAYMRVDYDKDGIAELRKITCLGNGYIVVDNEEIDDFPFACLTAIPMPHKFHGRDIADMTMDIQEWKSFIVRQMNDNLYLSNEPRPFVQGDVDMDDLLNSRLGAPVRGGPHSMVTPMTVPFVGGESLAVLEYANSMREERTGITRYSQGLDANSLNKTATGVQIIQEAAQGRQELIARMMAETGFKRLFKLILKLVCAHQQKEKMIRLRGEWVPMDPRSWKNSMDVTVSVGLGTGNKDQQLQRAFAILGIQERMAAFQQGLEGPLVNAENIRAVCEKIVEAAGWKSAEPYFMEPKSMQPQQPRPDPKMEEIKGKMQIEQQKAQIDQQKTQADMQLAQVKAQSEIQLAREKAALEFQLKAWELEQELGMRQGDLDTQALLKAIQIDSEKELSDIRLEHEKEMNSRKMDHEHEMGGRKIEMERELSTRKADSENELATRKMESETKRENRKLETSQAGKQMKVVQEATKAADASQTASQKALEAATQALNELLELKRIEAQDKIVDVQYDDSGKVTGGKVKQGDRTTMVRLQ